VNLLLLLYYKLCPINIDYDVAMARHLQNVTGSAIHRMTASLEIPFCPGAQETIIRTLTYPADTYTSLVTVYIVFEGSNLFGGQSSMKTYSNPNSLLLMDSAFEPRGFCRLNSQVHTDAFTSRRTESRSHLYLMLGAFFGNN